MRFPNLDSISYGMVFSSLAVASMLLGAAGLFLFYGVFVSAIDNVLKPLLMGRGLDVPMAIILVGTIGGMLASGIVGLFIGAVVLAVGYKLFMTWLDAENPVGA